MEMNNIYNMNCADGMKKMDAESGLDGDIATIQPAEIQRLLFRLQEGCNRLYRVTKPGSISCSWVVSDATIDGSKTGNSFRQALYFMKCGFKLYDTMPYMKANPIPQTQPRYEQMFEYMFCLSKGRPKTFNPIIEKCKRAGRLQQWGRTINTEEHTAKYLREDDVQMTRETKIHGNVFTYGIGGKRYGHPAVFPEKLAADQINSWSNEGDGA